MSERLSVIIPVRNGGTVLASCLQAIEVNEYGPVEVIVVSDDSTDDTVAIAERHECLVLELKEHVGAAGARNRGADAATGDILVFVDCDIILPRDALERVAADLAAHPEAAAVVGVYAPVGPVNDFWSQYKHTYLSHSFMVMPEFIGTTNTSITAVRRTAFLEVGGFDESLITSEDDVFGLSLVRAGHAILLDKQLTVQHKKRYTWDSLLRDDLAKSTNLAYHFLEHRMATAGYGTRNSAPSTARGGTRNPEPGTRNSVPFGHHRPALLLSVPAAYAVAGTGLWLLARRDRYALAAFSVSVQVYAALNGQYWKFVAEHQGATFAAKAAAVSVVEMLVAGVAIGRGAVKFAQALAQPRALPDYVAVEAPRVEYR